ncbi:response regulator receiver domain protein [Firmicutes bacterium CAG:95]|jgi:two-component system alkaline phosphatase synthesis response regulator PhoP|nr:response regulator receiver domain protein [Firmicutes bacterium CAG:95]
MALIYILEDDRNIREIEEIALKNADYEVVSFETAAEFRKRLKERVPDLLLLDLMLPDADGLRLVTQLRQNVMTMSLPVIMVTAKTTEIDKVRGLDSGADDYLTKPFSVMELISRVKALLRRSMKGLKERVITIGEISLDVERRKVTVAGERCELTYKEYELLKLLMNNAGIVTPREEILSKVWETDFEGESRTIDMHIKTLRQKLGSSANRIKTVRNVGYLFETSPI